MRVLALGSLLAGLMVISAPASPIFYEGLNYSLGELNGFTGGTGWSGAWSADPVTTEIVNPATALTYHVPGGGNVSGGNRALRFTGTADLASIIARSLPSQTGNVYFSFLFRENAGTINTNDFMAFWFDNDTTVTSSQTLIPSLGLKGNHGDGANTLDFASRLNLGSDVFSTAASTGTTYLIVGRLFKTAGNYNRFSLWINPTSASTNTPDVTASVATGSTTSFSRLGVRIANLDADDVVYVDEFRAGTTFADVVPLNTPDSAPYVLISSGLIAIALIRRRKILAV